MLIEKCTEPFSMLFPPTIKLQAQRIAARRGLSLGALIRSLIADEAMREFQESATQTTSYSHCPACGERLFDGNCASCGWPP